MKITLASIDIGSSNFAQYIEQFSVKKIQQLQKQYEKLPKAKKRRVKGPITPEIEQILRDTALSGTRLQTGVYDFTVDGGGWDQNARHNLLKHLDYYLELWNDCDMFVIEQQFFHMATFGKKGPKRGKASGANVDAIKIAEAVYMWFLDKFPWKIILYFGSQFKTQIFGAPWGIDKSARKKWSTQKSEEIYVDRGDQDMILIYQLARDVKGKRFKTEEQIVAFLNKYKFESIDCIELANKIVRNRQKLDDISDTLVQAQVFKYATMVACFMQVD